MDIVEGSLIFTVNVSSSSLSEEDKSTVNLYVIGLRTPDEFQASILDGISNTEGALELIKVVVQRFLDVYHEKGQ